MADPGFELRKYDPVPCAHTEYNTTAPVPKFQKELIFFQKVFLRYI